MDEKMISLPGWKIIRVIGKGSFGCVYEIEKEDEFGENIRSALKVISIPESSAEIEAYRDDGYDDASLTALYRSRVEDITSEFRLMNELKGCSNIVSYEDHMIVRHDDDIGYDILIRMELLTPLPKYFDQHFSGTEADSDIVMKLGADICGALERCGRHNIIHRDIKPQNIFVNREGDFKLGDFGIAKTSDHTTKATKTGTYSYMAPEVYWGRPYNASVDIYSLGMVLYWMLNERRGPFLPLPPETPKPAQVTEAMERRLHGEQLPAPKHGSEALKRIVLKACASDPKVRYRNPAEMRKDLEILMRITDNGAVPIPVGAVPAVERTQNTETVWIPVGHYERTADSFSDTAGTYREKNEEATIGLFEQGPAPRRAVQTEEKPEKTVKPAPIPVRPEQTQQTVKPAPISARPEQAQQEQKQTGKDKPKKKGVLIVLLAVLLLFAVGIVLIVLLLHGCDSCKQGQEMPAATPKQETVEATAEQPERPTPEQTEEPMEKPTETPIASIEVSPEPETDPTPNSYSTEWSDWNEDLPEYVNGDEFEVEEQTLYSYRQLEKTTSTKSSTKDGWELYDTRSNIGDYGPWSDWSQTSSSSSDKREVHTRDEYRYRNKEQTTSSRSSLSGWTLEDTVYSWGEYSSWSGWSASEVSASESRQVQTKTQYRYRTKSYTTSSNSSLSGWTLYDHSVSYGSWSSWQDTAVSASDTYDVETRQVQTGTRYHMAHYCTGNVTGAKYQTAPSNHTTNEVFNEHCTYHDLGWFDSLDDFYPYETEYLYKGSSTSTCYRCSNTCFRWYIMSTQNTYKTQYRYRKINHTYYYYKWSDWSDWTDSSVSATSDREVTTRTLYRYRDRQQVATYVFYRWGDWSAWSPNSVTSTSTRQVQSAVFYRYRDRVTETTYYFRRWTSWSEYSTQRMDESETVEVRKKTLYRYRYR